MIDIQIVSDECRRRFYGVINPLGRFMGRIGVHPNVLTIAGLFLSIITGILFCTGIFWGGAVILFCSGICDALDGTIARETGKGSKSGAFLDSTLDRYGDIFPLMGLAYYYAGGTNFLSSGDKIAGDHSPLMVLMVIFIITGSFIVSYTRARAEGLGVECRVGLMQRTERIVLLIFGALLGSIPWIGSILLKIILIILAISTNCTAISRIFYVRRKIL